MGPEPGHQLGRQDDLVLVAGGELPARRVLIPGVQGGFNMEIETIFVCLFVYVAFPQT